MSAKAEILLRRLMALVIDGTIVARDDESPLSTNRFVFTYNGVEYATEWERDDRPTLFVNEEMAIRDYAVKPLIHELAIRFRKPAVISPHAEQYRKDQETRQATAIDRALTSFKKK